MSEPCWHPKEKMSYIGGSAVAVLLAAAQIPLPVYATDPGVPATYTLDADFAQGQLINVNYTAVADQLQLNDAPEPFNFIWVAVSSKGTVVKIDTDTGAVLGEYKTAPDIAI